MKYSLEDGHGWSAWAHPPKLEFKWEIENFRVQPWDVGGDSRCNGNFLISTSVYGAGLTQQGLKPPRWLFVMVRMVPDILPYAERRYVTVMSVRHLLNRRTFDSLPCDYMVLNSLWKRMLKERRHDTKEFSETWKNGRVWADKYKSTQLTNLWPEFHEMYSWRDCGKAKVRRWGYELRSELEKRVRGRNVVRDIFGGVSSDPNDYYLFFGLRSFSTDGDETDGTGEGKIDYSVYCG